MNESEKVYCHCPICQGLVTVKKENDYDKRICEKCGTEFIKIKPWKWKILKRGKA